MFPKVVYSHLYCFYTSDLPKLLKTHTSVHVVLYADDIKVYGSYNISNEVEIKSALQTSLERMVKWGKDWDIPVNISKSSVLHIGSDKTVSYSHGGINVSSIDEIKDLGINISKTLKPASHIKIATKKSLNALFVLFRNVFITDPKILVRLYKTYVVPHLEYASQTWSPHLKKDIDSIERVQKTFTRILYHRVFPDSGYPNSMPCYTQRLARLGLKSLYYRRIQLDLILAFRILKGETRLRMSKYWMFRPTRGRTSTFNIQVSKRCKKRLVASDHAFFDRTANWLNKLPADVLASVNSNVFKKKLLRIDVLDCLGLKDHT